MDIEKLSLNLSSDDPATGLRASWRSIAWLRGRSAPRRVGPGKGLSWQQIGDALASPPIRAHKYNKDHHDHESVVPEVLHVWAIYLQASEEARRRGDRRTGTDHILLALSRSSIEVVLA